MATTITVPKKRDLFLDTPIRRIHCAEGGFRLLGPDGIEEVTAGQTIDTRDTASLHIVTPGSAAQVIIDETFSPTPGFDEDFPLPAEPEPVAGESKKTSRLRRVLGAR